MMIRGGKLRKHADTLDDGAASATICQVASVGLVILFLLLESRADSIAAPSSYQPP